MPLFNIEPTVDFVDILGYEGIYKINKQGQVLRVGGSVITKNGHTQRYPEKLLRPYKGQVYLSKEGHVTTFRVCDLVAQAYISEYKPGMKVYHISGDSDALSNLSLTLPVTEDVYDSGWRDIPGYEGYYQASRYGEIRSLSRETEYTKNNSLQSGFYKGRILKLHKGDDGYMHCSLSVEGKLTLAAVHRLVAATFIPNPDNKPHVNHIDGNKTNNNVDNLEWVTRSENMQHAKANHLWNPKLCGQISCNNAGIPVVCTTDNLSFESISKAANYYDMDFESVKYSIRSGKPSKGKQFIYAGGQDDECRSYLN